MNIAHDLDDHSSANQSNRKSASSPHARPALMRAKKRGGTRMDDFIPPSDRSSNNDLQSMGFATRVEANQRKLLLALRPTYDFIVCGSGSSGSVVAHASPKTRP
jgi:hypothetical protein